MSGVIPRTSTAVLEFQGWIYARVKCGKASFTYGNNAALAYFTVVLALVLLGWWLWS